MLCLKLVFSQIVHFINNFLHIILDDLYCKEFRSAVLLNRAERCWHHV